MSLVPIDANRWPHRVRRARGPGRRPPSGGGGEGRGGPSPPHPVPSQPPRDGWSFAGIPRLGRLIAAALTVVAVVAATAQRGAVGPPAAAEAGSARPDRGGLLRPFAVRDGWEPVTYVPPVAAPVADPFRSPVTPYGPGNRGIEYATAAGDQVRASAAGEVLFAGEVAGALHVTVGHADGVRTSYSFLLSIEVVPGQRLAQGALLGTAGDRFHLGARIGDVYVDPAVLFTASGNVHVELLPLEEPVSPIAEGRALAGLASTAGPHAPVSDRLDRWLRTGAPGTVEGGRGPGGAAGPGRMPAELGRRLRGGEACTDPAAGSLGAPWPAPVGRTGGCGEWGVVVGSVATAEAIGLVADALGLGPRSNVR